MLLDHIADDVIHSGACPYRGENLVPFALSSLARGFGGLEAVVERVYRRLHFFGEGIKHAYPVSAHRDHLLRFRAMRGIAVRCIPSRRAE